MYGQHFQQRMDQPGMADNSARGQLNREIVLSRFPFAPEKSVSRAGFGRPVPRKPAHPSTLRKAESGAYPRDSSRFPRQRHVHRQPPSGQSRFYPVTQLRTDDVHCREFAGTGPALLKIVPNGCCLIRYHHGPINFYSPLFSHTHYTILIILYFSYRTCN